METSSAILLAEDNPDDVLLVRLGFEKAGFDNPVISVPNGEEAIRYLKGEEQYADRNRFPIPRLLLLDLKMPRMGGFDVLTWVRQHPEWRCLPVVVLTTSCYAPDLKRAYDLGANSFLTKPIDFHESMAALREAAKFWLCGMALPQPGPFVPPPIPQPGIAPPEPASVPAETSVPTHRRAPRRARASGSSRPRTVLQK
jgi:CheY-like chemotaxis protein